MDLRTNLGLKITALFLAIFAWVYVHNLGDILTVISVPVDLEGIPAEYAIVGEPPPDTDVHLRGPAPTLNNLRRQDVALDPHLETLPLQPGLNSIALNPAMVRVPTGVTVDRITPSSFSIQLEPKSKKEVPVEAAIYGTPAEGYEMTSVTVVPSRLAIEGPESAVEAVERITTTRLSIANATETRRATVTPIPSGPYASQVDLSPPAQPVEVIVRIQPLQEERQIADILVVPFGVPATAVQRDAPRPRFFPDTVTVRVRGPRQAVNALIAEELVAVVDLAGRTGQNQELPAESLMVRAASMDAPPMGNLVFEVVEPATLRITWDGSGAS